MPRPRILFFSNWFAPGYAGGGSQTAATNLVRALGGEFDFFVVTRDRDAGEGAAYPNIASGEWTDLGDARVRYLAPRELQFGVLDSIIRGTPHDLIHLNSVVSLPFAACPLFLRQLRASSAAPLLISPHGEMAPSALAKKRYRKSFYLSAIGGLGMFKNAIWHAANTEEERDIRRVRGEKARVEIASVIPPSSFLSQELPPRPAKSGGILRAVFFARIDRMKNLDMAIDLVASLQDVMLDICGPVGQPDYWAECEARINASGRPDAFRYVGGIEPKDVDITLSQYDALFLPSQNESFGYAILDALAAGCPVLTSDQTPWQDLEAAGVGFAVALNHPAMFRAKLMELRDLDEATHQIMRARARSYARAYIGNSQAGAAMRAIYAKMLARAT